MVDFVHGFTNVTELPAWCVALRLAVHPQQFYRWVQRYSSANHHKGKLPWDHWLDDWERDAILAFHDAHPLEGYRRLSFMMLDARAVAVSPSTVHRALKKAGRLDRFRGKPSQEGTGFQQPIQPHERENLALLPAIEREDGALESNRECHHDSAQASGLARRSAAARRRLRRALQYEAAAQRDRLRDTGRQAGKPGNRDLGHTRPAARNSK